MIIGFLCRLIRWWRWFIKISRCHTIWSRMNDRNGSWRGSREVAKPTVELLRCVDELEGKGKKLSCPLTTITFMTHRLNLLRAMQHLLRWHHPMNKSIGTSLHLEIPLHNKANIVKCQSQDIFLSID